MSESASHLPAEYFEMQLLQRESGGNPEVLQAIVTREVRLDEFLNADPDTSAAADALRLYKINQNRVLSMKQRFGIHQPEPLPIETED